MCWGQLKATLKCAVLSHNTMPQMSQVMRERAIGMLTAGMSNRAVARAFNVNCSTISHLQRCFREFVSTSNQPHNRRLRVTTPAQDFHSSFFTCGIVWDKPPGQLMKLAQLNNFCTNGQKRLRDANLHARHPHRGLDLTAVGKCSPSTATGMLE